MLEFICCVIVNEEIVVGVDNIIISEVNFIFLNLRKMLIGKNIVGISISFLYMFNIMGFICFFIVEKLKELFRIISDKGVVILEILLIVLCKNVGILIFKISIVNFIKEVIMSGFVKMFLIICFIFILLFLKILRIIIDNILNIGIIIVINKDVILIFLLLNSEIVIGILNIMKLLWNIFCINVFFVLLFFLILGIIKIKIKKIEKIIIIVIVISLKLRELFKFVLYILKNNNNGKKDLK